MLNWRQTVLSQFANSPKLVSLLDAINQWISPDADFENFYQYVWNVLSGIIPPTSPGGITNDYGLDVWGRIVNIPRTVTLTSGQFFGFYEAGDRVGFGQGPFYNGVINTENFTLSNQAYLLLILAKAAFNITDGSIPAINALMMNLFPGRGNCWVQDGGGIPETFSPFGFYEAGDREPFGFGPFSDFRGSYATNMTITYVFTFPLQPFEIAIVQSGVLPKPTGVSASWLFLGN